MKITPELKDIIDKSKSVDSLVEKSLDHKSLEKHSLSLDLDPFSPLGSLSLISSSSKEEPDCAIVRCVEKNTNPSTKDKNKSVFIRTLHSGN